NSNKTPPPTAATNVVATNAVAVKIPPFWPSDPELWFAQVEAQFSVKNMTSQGTKFAHVVAALSPEAATEVRDLILTPPSTNPFDVLKATLTERVSLSKRRKIQQLLQAE
ncbi:gag-pol poly, partial [Paramuricea clavata]